MKSLDQICSSFSHGPVLTASWPFWMSIRGIDPVCPQAMFSGVVGDVVPFWNDMHHNYSIKMPKQHVILFKTEWGTCWRRFYVTVIDIFIYGLVKLRNYIPCKFDP